MLGEATQPDAVRIDAQRQVFRTMYVLSFRPGRCLRAASSCSILSLTSLSVRPTCGVNLMRSVCAKRAGRTTNDESGREIMEAVIEANKALKRMSDGSPPWETCCTVSAGQALALVAAAKFSAGPRTSR